jgi:hypothetical protein
MSKIRTAESGAIMCCRQIVEIIERVDNRCMAADGPVTDTRAEMTADEMVKIYRLAKRGAKP